MIPSKETVSYKDRVHSSHGRFNYHLCLSTLGVKAKLVPESPRLGNIQVPCMLLCRLGTLIMQTGKEESYFAMECGSVPVSNYLHFSPTSEEGSCFAYEHCLSAGSCILISTLFPVFAPEWQISFSGAVLLLTVPCLC